jgi:fused signal recognition particle receptor
MAEERKRGFFSRLFGVEDAPAAADAVLDGQIRGDPASRTGTMMSDGLVVPELPPSDGAPPGAEELAITSAAELEQLRTEATVTPPSATPAPAPNFSETMQDWWGRLRSGLSRSSESLNSGIADVFTKRRLDRQTLDELEELLIQADLGVETAARIADALAEKRLDKDVSPEEVRGVLAAQVEKTLAPVATPLHMNGAREPFVILMVGVNGTGKTTTIGKLAARFKREGRKVMLAAGDTFRAAAIEQLKIWGERAGTPVIARAPGSDAAGLAFDAMVEATKAGTEVLLIDTAGRLHNKAELMAELGKIVRVIRKHDPSAPHAVLLTLDATTGQNALNQVEVFRDQAGVTGLVMTKLDGTARGGILVAIAAKHGLPVHFIGVGEAIEDLAPFSAQDFARAIAGLD